MIVSESALNPDCPRPTLPIPASRMPHYPGPAQGKPTRTAQAYAPGCDAFSRRSAFADSGQLRHRRMVSTASTTDYRRITYRSKAADQQGCAGQGG